MGSELQHFRIVRKLINESFSSFTSLNHQLPSDLNVLSMILYYTKIPSTQKKEQAKNTVAKAIELQCQKYKVPCISLTSIKRQVERIHDDWIKYFKRSRVTTESYSLALNFAKELHLLCDVSKSDSTEWTEDNRSFYEKCKSDHETAS